MFIIKKVVIIFPRMEEFFSGAETYVSSLANHLSKRYEVHIITKTPTSGVYPDLQNVIMHYVEGLGSGNPNIFKCVPALHKTIEEINPDIVHIHCFITLMLYSLAVDNNKYKLIMTVHSSPDGKTKLFSWFGDLTSQKTYISNLYNNTCCNVTLFGSEYYMNEYLKHVPDIKKISKCYVNKYYSDLPEITIEERIELDSINKDKINILFPSRIVKRKGIEETLKLLTMLPDNYILTLPALAQIDNQEYNLKIRKMILDLNLQDRVIYPENKVIGSAMFDYYKKADVVIVPSYFEGFGIVAVEAMNCCCPVISTLTGGLNEIITDEYDGVKMNLDNLDDAKEKIIKLTQDKDYRLKIIKNAKDTYNKKFVKSKHMDLIDKIYEELV